MKGGQKRKNAQCSTNAPEGVVSNSIREAVRKIRALPQGGVITDKQIVDGLRKIDAKMRAMAFVANNLAPRPVLFIQGTADTLIPPSNARDLAAAARASGARVQLWLVPGAEHGQSFHVAGAAYVYRITAFFRAALGPA